MKKYSATTKTIRYFLLIAIILLGSTPTTAFAVDVDFFQSNDILYYDPGGGAADKCQYLPSVSSPLDVPTLQGKENNERIWNFLIDPDQGLTKEQAAGIMGNIEQDSNYNPAFGETASNPTGAYGIAGWAFERRAALEKAAKDKNLPASDLGIQLAFMVQEARSRRVTVSSGNDSGIIGDVVNGNSPISATTKNEWDALKKAKTIEDATAFWYRNYEDAKDDNTSTQSPNRPGIIDDSTPSNSLASRTEKAKKAFEQFSGSTDNDSEDAETNTSESKNQSSASTNGCSYAGGSLQQTVLAYAWPEYHESSFVEMMPAYAEAVKERRSQGKWVGGYGDGPGIDCGGFVTILLVNSGFEPRYNYEDKSGWGAVATGQLPWLEENWTLLGRGGSISSLDLQPGDVAIKIPATHTFIYVGEIDGFENTYASASLGNRSPMAARASNENVEQTNYNWYRKK